MFDLQRLRALHSVARHGSISAAAEAMYLTASAVSQQISKLESEVGQQLLERQGRGVRLTDAAHLLVSHADRILSLVENARAELEATRGEVVGELSVAAFATAARDLVPPALRHLVADYPELGVRLHESEPDAALPQVSRGNLDVAVVDAWVNAPLVIPDQLAKAHLMDDTAELILPADHRLATRDVVDLTELGDQDWVSWPRKSICHDWLVHTLRGLDVEPRIAHTAMEHATQVALVEAGLGAAVIPRLGRGPLPAGVRAVPVEPSLVRQVFAVWRDDASRRPAIVALVEALRRQAESTGEP